MIKQYFVKQGIKEVAIQNFIKNSFPAGDYSEIALQRTPLGLKVVIFTNKPGRIIGRGGRNIDKINDALKERFQLENPQIDIKSIPKPDLDAKIVAKQIASALERGYNYKKIGNIYLKRVMDAGAIGVEIIIKGRLGGSMARMGKFIEGYLKHSGQTAKELVDHGFYTAKTQPGIIGVSVKIMTHFQSITGERTDYHPDQIKKQRIEIPKEEVGPEKAPKEESADKKEKPKKSEKTEKKKEEPKTKKKEKPAEKAKPEKEKSKAKKQQKTKKGK